MTQNGRSDGRSCSPLKLQLMKLMYITTSNRTVVQSPSSIVWRMSAMIWAFSDKLINGGIRATKGIDIPKMPDVCTYVCMHVQMYVHIYIYIYIFS